MNSVDVLTKLEISWTKPPAPYSKDELWVQLEIRTLSLYSRQGVMNTNSNVKCTDAVGLFNVTQESHRLIRIMLTLSDFCSQVLRRAGSKLQLVNDYLQLHDAECDCACFRAAKAERRPPHEVVV